nr:hypothetical protein [Tanacetum cinerariifolium]
MASEHNSLELAFHEMTPTTIILGIVPNLPPSTPFVIPSRTNWDLLFQPLFDGLLNPLSSVDHPALEVIALITKAVAPEPAASTVISNDVEEENHDIDVAHMNNDSFIDISIPENDSKTSSYSNVIPIIMHTAAPNSQHVTK